MVAELKIEPDEALLSGILVDFSTSPDGQQYAVADDSYNVHLWSTAGQRIAKLDTLQTSSRGGVAPIGDRVARLSFSPDSKLIVTGGYDGTIRLWSSSGKQIAQFQKQNASISSVSFSPTGKKIATASSDGIMRLWNLSGHQIAEFRGREQDFQVIRFSPDGQQIATGGVGAIRLWQVDGQSIAEFRGDYGSPWYIAFSSDGKQLITSEQDTVHVWNVVRQRLVKFDQPQYIDGAARFIRNSVTRLRFTADSKTIIT